MTRKVKLEVTLHIETDDKMTDSEAVNLAKTHIMCCIADNPDADGSRITFSDVRVK